ncbi:hypothetical protein K0M31_017129, partial [Melipona bicolor]
MSLMARARLYTRNKTAFFQNSRSVLPFEIFDRVSSSSPNFGNCEIAREKSTKVKYFRKYLSREIRARGRIRIPTRKFKSVKRVARVISVLILFGKGQQGETLALLSAFEVATARGLEEVQDQGDKKFHEALKFRKFPRPVRESET